MTHDDCRDLLALHALGAVHGVDEGAIASHVACCPSCATDLADLRATAASLAYLGRSIEPSPEHLERVLAAIDRASRPRRAPARLRLAQRGRRARATEPEAWV